MHAGFRWGLVVSKPVALYPYFWPMPSACRQEVRLEVRIKGDTPIVLSTSRPRLLAMLAGSLRVLANLYPVWVDEKALGRAGLDLYYLGPDGMIPQRLWVGSGRPRGVWWDWIDQLRRRGYITTNITPKGKMVLRLSDSSLRVVFEALGRQILEHLSARATSEPMVASWEVHPDGTIFDQAGCWYLPLAKVGIWSPMVRPAKALTRWLVGLEVYVMTRRVRRIFDLPGADLEDYPVWRSFWPQAQIVGAEKDPDTFEAIKTRLSWPVYRDVEVWHTSADRCLAELAREGEAPFDFIHLDVCGPISRGVRESLHCIVQERLADGGVLALTTTRLRWKPSKDFDLDYETREGYLRDVLSFVGQLRMLYQRDIRPAQIVHYMDDPRWPMDVILFRLWPGFVPMTPEQEQAMIQKVIQKAVFVNQMNAQGLDLVPSPVRLRRSAWQAPVAARG